MVRRRPWTTVLVLALLLLAGSIAGVYGYAFYQWHAAEVALKQERSAEARDRLDFCLRLWPLSRSVRLHLLAARAARMTGDLAGAEAHLIRCKKLQGGATDAIQLEFLLMRVQMGEADEVKPALLTYVDNKHPETGLILRTLSGAYMHNLRFRSALDCLNRWIQEAPDEAEAYHWRGWVLERMNEREAARKDYQRAVELDPDLIAARLRLAEMYLERSNPPEALPHLERLSRQAPDRSDVKARLGQCRFLQGDLADARRLMEEAVRELPDDVVLLITLGKLELQEHRPVEAEQWLRRALKVDPTDTEAQYQLVTALQFQGRDDEAAAVLEQYKKDQELLARANQLLRDEVERPSNSPTAPYEVGALFLRTRQERLGLYWLHQALDRDPMHRPTLETLADYYEKKGDKDAAASYRKRLPKAEKAAPPRP
jgi:tetratricopeptide (TPR) repeat protein